MIRLAALVLIALSATYAWAADSTWTNTAGGIFNVGANWSAGVPAVGNIATFNLGNTYTVTFTNNPSNNTVEIEDGNVTFALSGQTYSLTGPLKVGAVAGETGRLTLVNGSIVSGSIVVGDLVAETGILTVSSNATANAVGSLIIGQVGAGTLTVQNGGVVSASASVNLGTAASSLGTLTVTGEDSRLSTGGLINLGSAGSGTVSVSAGGEVVSGSARLGILAGSDATATVTGAGSRWTMTGGLIVADDGDGEMSVLNGGVVESGGSSIAAQNDGVGDVTIAGAGSLWQVGGSLNVGSVGKGALTVSSAGRLATTTGVLGSAAGGNGSATITGANSIWTTSGNLTIGASGLGAVSVLDGARITTLQSTLGSSASGDGSLTVDGAGSTYDVTGNLIVGAAGKGIATVSNAATLSLINPTARIEVANNSASGFVSSLVITGAGSTVNAPGGVYVSGSNTAAGGTGSLLIAGGAKLNASGGTVKIWPVLMAQISLQGGTIHARHFERIGSFDFRDGLLHVDGGTFTAGAAPVGLGITGFDADDRPTLRLSNNATTQNITSLTVGNAWHGALEILSGADVAHAAFAAIGQLGGSSGAALVSGSGSTWTTPASFTIGDFGSGTLDVSDGATVTSGPAHFGVNSGAVGVATVTTGGIWAHHNADIGVSGTGTLSVRDGGGVGTGGTATLGAGAGGRGTVNVTGAGSLWTAAEMFIGNFGRGTLSISDSGLARSTNAGVTLGNGAGGSGDVTIDGPGSRFEINGELAIGVNGAGSVSVVNGGELTSFSVALAKNSSGGFAIVSGPGSTWTNAGSLVIGGTTTTDGGIAGLTVEKGGVLNTGTAATDTLMIRGDGTLTLDGGTINARRFQRTGASDFNFHDGLLNITGGDFNPGGSLTIDGADADDLPTLRLASGATTTGITTLTVGNSRRGALEITAGSQLTSTEGNIAAQPGSTGHIDLKASSLYGLANSLSVGGSAIGAGGNGTLTIGQGALVNVQSGLVRLYTNGVINLNGGTLNMEAFQPLGGTFNFNSGMISYIGGATLSDVLLTTFLGAQHSLSAGRNLTAGLMNLAGPLSVDGGSLHPTVLNVGSVLQVNTGTVNTLSSSTIQPAGLLRLANTGVATFGTLTNNGVVELAADTATLGGSSLVNNGIVLGGGRVTASLTNNAAGSIRAENGARLHFLGSSNSNAGRIEALSGGTIEFQQTLNNSTNALITGRDGVLRFNGGLNNAGSLGFSSGNMDVFGDINNTGAASKIVVSGRGTATFYDDVVNNGQIQVSTDSTAVYFGAVTGGGSFPGGGTNFFEGDLRPGNSPAIINFAGDVEFGSAATLEVEIGGLTAGTQHDQINIGGQATLNGTLDIELINGFTPTLGQQFQIMTFGSRVGMFPMVTGADFSPTLQLEPIYSATDLKLVVVANAGEKIWGVDAGGQASVGANWFGGVPPTSPNDAIAFTTVITANRSVTVDVPLSLRRMRFNDDNNYTIAGPQTITLAAPGPDAAAIIVENANGNGAHAISAPLVISSNLSITQDSNQPLTIGGAFDNSAGRTITTSGTGAVVISGAQTHGTGAVMTVSAGTANINTNAGSSAVRNLTVNANSATNFGSTQHLAALNVGAGATAMITAGGPKNVVANALTIAGGSTPTGKLDVTNNAVIVDYPAAGPNPVNIVRDQIIAGRGGSGLNKTWNGQGITSSTAGAAPTNSMSVGYAVNGTLPLAVYSNFRGQAVDPSSVLLRFTRTADANLDGVVNTDDVAVVGANYAPGAPKPRWDLGDFDYNGFVDNDDITLLGAFFNPAAPPIPAPVQVDESVAAVPEPATAILAISALILAGIGRRSRRDPRTRPAGHA